MNPPPLHKKIKTLAIDTLIVANECKKAGRTLLFDELVMISAELNEAAEEAKNDSTF